LNHESIATNQEVAPGALVLLPWETVTKTHYQTKKQSDLTGSVNTTNKWRASPSNAARLDGPSCKIKSRLELEQSVRF